MKSQHLMPYGAEMQPEGVRFSLWAPAGGCANLHLNGHPPLAMKALDRGFFELVVGDAGPGSRYSYSFDDNPQQVPDPASRFNPEGVHAPSEVIDPRAYEWRDESWKCRPWREAVIYEMHVGSFTAEGSFTAAAGRLDYLAGLGVTAVELMPVAATPGRRNWGYDGVLPFAPCQTFGRPEELKAFVDAAHARGLMVVLDVVYNHFGPEGNYLRLYAPRFFTDHHHTPWGDAINFDGADSPAVREFFINNALYWLEEFHFDGLRLDAVHAIVDDSEPSFLDDLAARVSERFSANSKHLVLENLRNEVRYLEEAPIPIPIPIPTRTPTPPPPPPQTPTTGEDAAARESGKRPAYVAQWNDDFHHAMHVLLTGERAGYYMDFDKPAEQLLRCLTEGFAYQGETSRFSEEGRGEPSAHLPTTAFINFLQNHDQIGNRAYGERLSMLANGEQMCAAETLLLLLPTPILLFMGEEFHAPNPFVFFCDYDGQLGETVTQGRRNEFKDFFAGIGELDSIPDPNDAATAAMTKLDWSALENSDSDGNLILARYRRLLGLRSSVIAPRLPARVVGGRMLGSTALTAAWRLNDGATLTLIANLGAKAQSVETSSPGELLQATPSLRERGSNHLPPWCVAWFHAS